jgi:hypothetical protein
MPSKPIKDFLFYIEDCHKALADLYQRLSIEASDEKAKLLLDYMKNQQQISYTNIHQYVQIAPLSLLETWLDTFFDLSFPLRCKNLKLKAEITIEDVVNLAIQLDLRLIEVMQTAAFISPTIEAEKALEILTNQEEEMLHQVMIVSHEFDYI